MAENGESATEEAIDDLYAGDLDTFVQRRDALARTLKTTGRTDDARRVKALRRPTIAAAALNETARTRVDEVAAYLEAGRALIDASERGNDPDDLRRTIERHRRLQRQLVDEAVATLERRGHNAEAARADIQRTLDAATLDPQVAETVRSARLSTPVSPGSGFDVLTVAAQTPPRGRSPQARPAPAPGPEPRESARARHAAERLEAARRETARAEAAADDAGREVRRLEAELDRSRRAAERADTALERAREAQRRAEAAIPRR